MGSLLTAILDSSSASKSERNVTKIVMFESKEEVNKAIMDLKLFEDMDGIDLKKNSPEEVEDSEEITSQIFPEHDAMTDRFCKTLYYGKQPASDRPSLAFTNIAVDEFTNVGLDALGEKLGRLDMTRAADITRSACAGPNSLVLALLYLDKLRKRNPDYLTTVSSADLFLVSLMVASKFLHDDGEEDEVFNDEWASSGGIDTKELNRLELSFLSALDWRVYVTNQEFEKAVEKVETDIAFKEVSKRGWASYTDLDVLSMSNEIQSLLSTFLNYTLKMTAVCVTAYAAGLLSLIGTAALLEKTPVGPEAVATSFRTLRTSFPSVQDNQDTIDQVPDYDNLNSVNESTNAGVTPADLISASLLVTTLTAGVSSAADSDVVENERLVVHDITKHYDDGMANLKINQTQGDWIADNSEQTKRISTGEYQPKDKGFHDLPSILGYQGDLHHLSGRKGTGSSDNLGLVVAHWSQLMTQDPLTDYLGRCPVLKWSSYWRHSRWITETSYWIKILG